MLFGQQLRKDFPHRRLRSALTQPELAAKLRCVLVSLNADARHYAISADQRQGYIFIAWPCEPRYNIVKLWFQTLGNHYRPL